MNVLHLPALNFELRQIWCDANDDVGSWKGYENSHHLYSYVRTVRILILYSTYEYTSILQVLTVRVPLKKYHS